MMLWFIASVRNGISTCLFSQTAKCTDENIITSTEISRLLPNKFPRYDIVSFVLPTIPYPLWRIPAPV